MPNIVNIFNAFKNPDAKDDEVRVVDFCNDYLESSQFLINILTDEDLRSRLNQRNIKSKILIQDAMVIHLMLENFIFTLIEYYLEDYGESIFIKKLKAFFINKAFSYHEETIKPYLYLVDMKECIKIANKCIND